ncbi:MAG: HAD family phosphatase [Ruminococcaceae bacterium]|nr:HAD family phosphatase [Oscillospiraceae bacterium]
MKLEGAIFDVDGTLLDSMVIWDTIGGNYLRSRGITPKPGLDARFRSMSLYQAVRHYQDEYGLTDSADALMAGVNAMIEDYYAHQVQPKAGVPAFLESLHKRGVRMCLATATDHHLVEAALTRTGLWGYFGGVFTCSGVGHGKDEPHIFHTALHFLGTPKAATCVFEDALYAVRTAKQAGFTVAAVQDPFEHDGDTVQKLADYYITHFHETEGLFT